MKSFKLNAFFALLAGAALVLAFEPIHLYWMGVFSPGIFFLLISRYSAGRASLLGFLYGLGFFGVGATWVYVAIYVFGGTPRWLAITITALFAMVLACFFAILGFILQKVFSQNTPSKILIIFPSLWALLEVLRSYIFTGFPWLILGHIVPHTIFSGFAPIVGAYGTSFLLVFCSGLLLMEVILGLNSGQQTFSRGSNFALLGFVVFFVIAYLLKMISWTTETDKPFNVSLVQGNIQQSLRWDPEEVNNIVTTYLRLTPWNYRHELIVWPEAAIPLSPDDAAPLLEVLEKKLTQTHSVLLMGMPIREGIHYYNAVIAVGEGAGIYRKRHLVPFGEYVPWEKYLRGLVQFFNLPMSQMIPGEKIQPLITAYQIPVGVYICYEIAYDDIVRSDLPAAKLLITVSDDAWFGDSLAPDQHLQIAQFQSLATGRPMLVVGNNGITAVIDQKGIVRAKIKQFVPGVLNEKVSAFEGTTPWVRWGDMPWIILMLISVVFAKINGR